MKYKDGRQYRRKIGQSRMSQSIYDNLGHPHDVRGKDVEFIGKEEKAYSLTKGKTYNIIDTDSGEFNYDADIAEKFKDEKERRVESSQGEDYFIIIMNDKGNKRRYSHLMFKRVKNKDG